MVNGRCVCCREGRRNFSRSVAAVECRCSLRFIEAASLTLMRSLQSTSHSGCTSRAASVKEEGECKWRVLGGDMRDRKKLGRSSGNTHTSQWETLSLCDLASSSRSPPLCSR
mmetsp:Transcript_51057/g.108474  ORF Transcript_51057/g.108474 Transcript_51057/m.108474 type:complete len:112 (+) Transcript_51057:1227-1562(+)